MVKVMRMITISHAIKSMLLIKSFILARKKISVFHVDKTDLNLTTAIKTIAL